MAILFVTINIRDSMQRPFHRERVNNFITAAKDLIQKNEQLEITEIGEGGRMKGGGWGNHIRFKSNLSEEKTVELIIPPVEHQKIFVNFAKKINKSKATIQKALDEAQLLFDSLMQQYFG